MRGQPSLFLHSSTLSRESGVRVPDRLTISLEGFCVASPVIATAAIVEWSEMSAAADWTAR